MSWFSSAASACIVVSLGAVSAAAQGAQLYFGLGTGIAIPVGDYHATASGQGFNTAWHGLALLAFKLPALPVGFRLDASYCANSANDRLKADLTTALGQPADEQAKLLGASFNVTYQYTSPVRVKPYAIGGIGLYHTAISVTTRDSTTNSAGTRLGWNLGGGLVYSLRGVALFFEARYVSVGAMSGLPNITFLPFTAGIRFGQ